MTPEEIAEKVAKSMVRVEPWNGTSGSSYVDIGEEGMDQDLAAGMIERHEAVLIYAEDCRKFFAAKILEAIETALRQCPVPGGLEDGLIDHIRQEIPHALKFSRESLATYLGALMGHIDHLHRIMHTPESESIARAYDEGYQKGCREMIDKSSSILDGRIIGDFGIISAQNHQEEP